MTQKDDEARVDNTLRGRVKWFDPVKGFGFVVSDAGGRDILLHANVLRNFGQSSVADGAGIEIAVQETDRGFQATEVIAITPPPEEEGDVPEGAAAPAVVPGDIALMVPARVKWFDPGKGFGFANVFGDPADVFVHADVLRRSGLADLQAGEAICLQVADGERGLLAEAVWAWDSVVLEEEDEA